MKGKVVPALWSKRGLHRGSGAEPQVVGLAPQTTQEKKADTMKTYLLKASPAVEPKARRHQKARAHLFCEFEFLARRWCPGGTLENSPAFQRRAGVIGPSSRRRND